MTVRVVVEKPHSFWYTTYSGDGALDADAKSTKIAAIAAKAVGIESRPARLREGMAAETSITGCLLSSSKL